MDHRHLAFGLIASLLAGLAGCSETATAKKAPEPRASVAKLALSYQPKDHPTDRAIAAAQTAVSRAPTESALIDLATLFMRRRRETGEPVMMVYAEDAVRAGRELSKDQNPKLLLLSAMLLHDKHAFDEAMALGKKALALDPRDVTAHIVIGDAKLEKGDYEGATDAYQSAMDIRPDLRTYNRAAHLRWLHGDFEGATELIDMALDAGSARDPESSAWCYVDLGTMYWHRGEADRAVEAASRALELVPGYLPALHLRGRALWIAGDKDEAAKSFEEVVSRHASAEVLLELSELSRELDRSKDADELLARAVKLAQHDPRPLSLYYSRHGVESDRSLALAERELEARAPIEARDAHALALYRVGRIDEARAAIQRAQQLNTPDARLDLHAGLIAFAAKDRDAASAALDRALKRNPKVDPLLVRELSDLLGEK